MAIKVLTEQFAADPERLRRFTDEARAIAALNHPHICQLHDVGPGYLVLEYIEGDPPRGPMTAAQALPLALQIASALEAAHARGILHRDLKPANIMVTRQGTAKLLDFGLAKLVSEDADVTGTMAGTVLGHGGLHVAGAGPGPVDSMRARTSSVLARCCTNCFPRAGPLTETRRPTCSAPCCGTTRRRCGASPALERIVGRCLAKQPGQRFQTMGELRAALEARVGGADFDTHRRQPSIAVLPFANMSADRENEYFGDGLAEEIINVLAQVPGLKVAGRTSSFFFRGKDVEFGEIGRRLNVEHILEGSVRKAGNRIRVTAQLIKVADGFHLWSERYDREMTDIFAIQDEITQAIAAALRIKLSPEAATAARHAPNLRAYEAYLKARDYWFKPTPESLALVKASLDHAIELDPEFALAHSLLGGHYTMLGEPGHQAGARGHPAGARSGRRGVARRSVAAGSARPAGRVRRQTTSTGTRRNGTGVWRWPANRFHATFASGTGTITCCRSAASLEAVEAMARGLQEDPLNLLYRHHLAVGLRHAGRLDDAEAELRKVLEIDENFPLALGTLGAICAQQGRFEEALAWTERAQASTPLGAADRRTARGGAGANRSDGPRRRVARRPHVRHGVRRADRAWRRSTRWAGTSIGRRNGPSARSTSGIRHSSRSWGRCCATHGSGPPWRN